jgi:hypothetical protein
MVGETFNDLRFLSAQRQIAAQQAQQQQTAIQNVNAAKAEAERHVQRGSFTTIPTSVGTTIVRSNAIGYSAPSVSSMRGLTPNGSVQQAMKPSMQTPDAVNRPLFTNTQTSRPFLSGTTTQNRRII